MGLNKEKEFKKKRDLFLELVFYNNKSKIIAM